MDFIKEFYRFAVQRRKVWLIPILLSMLIIGALLVFAESSALAPFIYTLF